LCPSFPSSFRFRFSKITWLAGFPFFCWRLKGSCPAHFPRPPALLKVVFIFSFPLFPAFLYIFYAECPLPASPLHRLLSPFPPFFFVRGYDTLPRCSLVEAPPVSQRSAKPPVPLPRKFSRAFFLFPRESQPGQVFPHSPSG